MIVSRTPYRISFFGGGTDYPPWYLKHGGAVLATTIDKYLYLSCRKLPPFFDHKYRLVYSVIELCKGIDEIVHPAIRGVLNFMNIEDGLEIHYDGDLPSRSGVGSSSVFVVGLLNTMYALKGGMVSKSRLASEACLIEQEVLGETVGSQDQTSAAYGGFNYLSFSKERTKVEPITIGKERLSDLDNYLMLFFTRITRNATDIARTYIESMVNKEEQLHKIREMVDRGLEILTDGGNLIRFGELLHEGWLIKQQLGDAITNPEVNRIYENARGHGAVGGKLLGAGGGGFMLLFVPPENQPEVLENLKDLVYVPFRFESSGSQIILYEEG